MKSSGNGIETTLLTPALARKLLANQHSMGGGPEKIKQFADMMKAGRWQVVSVILYTQDKRGRTVTEGVSRCRTVVASGVSIPVRLAPQPTEPPWRAPTFGLAYGDPEPNVVDGPDLDDTEVLLP